MGCSSTSMRSAANSERIFRTNGTRHILTGRLRVAAADLSLAQISDALGFTDRVNGLLHASNFTFRGNLAEPDRATRRCGVN